MSNFTILVTGDRDWTDYEFIQHHIALYLLELRKAYLGKVTLVHGDAAGVDTIADSVGRAYRLDVIPVTAKWSLYGKSAGPIRNNYMLKTYEPDIVLAFHDDLASSRGTKNMVKIAEKANVPVRLYAHESK